MPTEPSRTAVLIKLPRFHTATQIRHLLQTRCQPEMAKAGGYERQMLEGKNIALTFEKEQHAHRTRFEVAGLRFRVRMSPIVDHRASHIGHKETMKD